MTYVHLPSAAAIISNSVILEKKKHENSKFANARSEEVKIDVKRSDATSDGVVFGPGPTGVADLCIRLSDGRIGAQKRERQLTDMVMMPTTHGPWMTSGALVGPTYGLHWGGREARIKGLPLVLHNSHWLGQNARGAELLT